MSILENNFCSFWMIGWDINNWSTVPESEEDAEKLDTEVDRNLKKDDIFNRLL